MISVSKRSSSGVRAARAAAILVVLITCGLVVHAQAPQPPYALFQYASLTGSGNTITASQIPVVTSTGVTVYENLTLQFNVDANGNLTISSGYPQIIPAPTLLTSGFKAGTYAGPSNVLGGKALITVSGPGVTDGGATQWSLTAAAGADPCTYPSTGTWYVGSLANNPYAPWLKASSITSTAWSYGFGAVATTASPCSANGPWNNALIGASQTGNTITIVNFGPNEGEYSAPVAQITYTLQQ